MRTNETNVTHDQSDAERRILNHIAALEIKLTDALLPDSEPVMRLPRA